MDDSADHLDELLKEALGLSQCGLDPAEDAEPVAIKPALYASILDSAAKLSSELLASAIVKSASLQDWSIDDLAEEAGGDRDVARAFLTQGGDPRRLRPRIMARLLWRADLDPRGVVELINQAVVSYARYPELQTGMTWARTAGLSGEERTRALDAESRTRDPERAATDARLYFEDVMSVWQKLGQRTDDST